MSMIPHRFLLFCYQHSATQEIHFLRPLRKLIADGICQIVLIEEKDIDTWGRSSHSAITMLWDKVRPTLVIFSRYAGRASDWLVDTARKHSTPIMAHLDDDLFDVPMDLGERKYRFHHSPARLRSLDTIFRSADLIYVPTEPLAECFRRRGFEAPICIPPLQVGADPNELCPPRRSECAPLTIGYMGTASHQRDLDVVVPALARLMKTRSDINFQTFGTIKMPSELAPFGNRLRALPMEKNYSTFLAKLCTLEWDIGLAPLRNTNFNGYRTYTKWLEYTIAGIPVLASDRPIYQTVVNPDAGMLATDNAWWGCLSAAVDCSARHEYVQRAQAKIVQSFRSETLASFLVSLGARPLSAEVLQRESPRKGL